MCFGGGFGGGGSRDTSPEWLAFQKVLEDVPLEHVTSVANAMRTLGEAMRERDFHRGIALFDASALLDRVKAYR